MEEQPQSKSALVKNLSTGSFRNPSRRVALEMPTHHRTCSSPSDINSSIDHLDKRRCHPCCFGCCAWTCVVVFVLIIAFLFVGIAYVGFLKSGMPEVNVRMFNITKLQVDNNTQKMDAIINLVLKVSNKNEKLKLFYSPLSVDVASDDVPLGKTKVHGFSQMPMNDTNLNMTMVLENADVNTYAVDDLKSDIKAYEMVFDVYVNGKIGFQVGSWHMSKVPFLVSCHQIKRMDVDFGRRPPCNVKMFAIR
ncbi:uncharacterized protein LOC113850326 [Abrus precatorius]|uniref:Uncharacterized protein LOC113850326 n=1 Tax=Abrus precatorius TaxID=3816 RepID=A0A8B8K0W7_ABRPR|nr:uncharacterized protein LOC113850326 [Abrus precatorius]